MQGHSYLVKFGVSTIPCYGSMADRPWSFTSGERPHTNQVDGDTMTVGHVNNYQNIATN